MSSAPIIIFAFNRLESLKHTVSSLLQNEEAAVSDLFVFVDGPRPNKDGEEEKVHAVRDYIKSINGFKTLTYTFSDSNQGLGPSIISGVTDVIREYGKAIVLEDDLIFTQNFLSFMNQGLEKYADEHDVFSICGYTNKVSRPLNYVADSYFCTRSSSWGWATWADRWASVDWELKDWSKYATKSRAFNRWGGSDCWHMLNEWHEGGNQSWAIRFCFAQFLQDKYSLFPLKSLVKNDGFDGNGTNCKKWSRFKYELADSGKRIFVWPSKIEIEQHFYKEAMRYHSIPMRFFSKLMYLIKR